MTMTFLWPMTGAAAESDAASQTRHFHLEIPQQPLQASLRNLARITGLQIARFSDVGVDSRNVNAVQGEFTAAEALDRLLQGTGLTYHFVNDRTVAIVRGKTVLLQPQSLPSPMTTASISSSDELPQPRERTGQHSWFSKVLTVFAACGPLASTHVCAQETATGKGQNVLEEVVVTARKREENLQTVPVAITALSGESLRENSVQTLEDVRFHAPALQISPSPFGSAVPGISIRGQRQLEALITLDPAVGVYFADVVWERPHGANASMYDLSSVQVLKGPQGTLFGRNTTGGAVLISPNKPSFAGVGAYVDVTAGNYNTRNYAAMLNLPISDAVAIRFAGQINKHAGYTDNLYNNSRKDDGNDQSYRMSITLKPSGNLESTTFYQYFRERTASNGWRLAGVNPNGAIASTAAGGGANVVAALQNTLALLHTLDWHDVIDDQLKGEDVQTHHVSNTTILNVGGVTFKNILGWRQVDSFNAFDYDGSAVVLNRTAALDNGQPQGPVTVFNSQNSLRVHQLSEEFQVLGTAFDRRLDWITGLYYFREQGPDVQRSDLFGRRINDGAGENKSKSIFAQGTYKFPWVDGLSLTAGARETWDDREVDQHQKLMPLGGTQYNCRLTNPPATPGGPAVVPNPCSRHRTYEDKAPTWGLTLDYAFTPDTMVYVARRRGYKSGGLQLRANAYTEPATFNPEYVDDWELGVKSTFDLAGMPMRINAAGYHQDFKDIQRTVSVLTPGGLVTTVLNAGQATIKGAEIELTLKPIRALELSASINITDAKYDKFTQAASSGPQDVSKSSFSMIPKNAIAGSAKYELPFPSDIGTISLRGNWYQQSRMEVTDINVVNGVRIGEGQVPAYHLADAFVDWNQVMNQPFDVRLYVRNLTNEDYATGGISVFSSGIYSYTLGAPRTYGIELRYRMGTEKERRRRWAQGP